MNHTDRAWYLLCKDMSDGLHQYDYWEQVSEKVKNIYLTKAIQENNKK